MAEWGALRRFTPARVALGRAGNGLPTAAHLAFQAAHAAARDEVGRALDVAGLARALAAAGFSSIAVRSSAEERRIFLRRPDLGRRLAAGEAARLGAAAAPGAIAFVVADGLAAEAVAAEAVPLLSRVVPALVREGQSVAPVVIAEQGRVALGDEIGAALRAEAVAVLIGERPGLSAPRSMGIYLTWAPQPGRTTDAERNCISNIRPGGLSRADAAETLLWLMREMRRRRLTGVALKDERHQGLCPWTGPQRAMRVESPTPPGPKGSSMGTLDPPT
ncbi:MAG TPA: ethanolamine ammonia-lyase subunit EutC, partial [Acetobacteraceae bacterium]|nr:ethanolamine ammonia-lyase subunit EutC [Acetobacteraceae bacterium]